MLRFGQQRSEGHGRQETYAPQKTTGNQEEAGGKERSGGRDGVASGTEAGETGLVKIVASNDDYTNTKFVVI